jgi:chromosome segregation ATPase
VIRVCPQRDAICPHGRNCPYTIDRYTCRPEGQAASGEIAKKLRAYTTGSTDDGIPALDLMDEAADTINALERRAEAAEAALAECQADYAQWRDVAVINTTEIEKLQCQLAELREAQHNYTDEDYHNLHKAHCHTAEQLAAAEQRLEAYAAQAEAGREASDEGRGLCVTR